jgi:hypothetical protein
MTDRYADANLASEERRIIVYLSRSTPPLGEGLQARKQPHSSTSTSSPLPYHRAHHTFYQGDEQLRRSNGDAAGVGYPDG